MSTITIRLPEPLTRRLRENDVHEQTVRTVVVEALQRWLDARVKRARSTQPLPTERAGEATGKHEYFRRILMEMYSGVPPLDDEPFTKELTRREYFALSEEEDKALWDKWYAEEMDKTENEMYHVCPNAILA